MSNTLIAIRNLITSFGGNAVVIGNGAEEAIVNRIQAVGAGLEQFVKDLYAGSIAMEGQARQQAYDRVFSWKGSKNHTPDAMLRGGDAIEIKKSENMLGRIHLNSSYPKAKLHSANRFVNDNCRRCEDWNEKDIVYVLGSVIKGELQQLWFLYGDCYFANYDTYADLHDNLKARISELEGFEFGETDELGRIHNADFNAMSSLRVRGMWEFKHPSVGFNNLGCYTPAARFQMHCIMKSDKYESLPECDRTNLEALMNEQFTITDEEIQNPNNTAILAQENLQVKLISYKII